MNEKKLKIGIDIDEVVVEFLKGYLKFHEINYGLKMSFEEIKNYNLWETNLFKNKEEAISGINSFQNSNDFDKLDFVEGAKESLLKLKDSFDIYFITSRPQYLEEKTSNFLKGILKEFGLHFSGDLFGGNKTKSEICEVLGINIFIEDNHSYALDLARKNVKTFLLSKPWNKNYEEHENITKVNNWKEILENLR